MPAPLISRDEVIARITEVFKSRGYEGASLANLSEKTGLVKASLYHYFPAGKKAMAEAALDAFGQSMENEVVAPLLSDKPPKKRLLAMLDGIDRVYHGGADLCLFALLSVGETRSLFQASIMTKVAVLAHGISQTLRETGLSAEDAQAKTEKMIVEIEGALIVARVLGDAGVFQRMLTRLRTEIG